MPSLSLPILTGRVSRDLHLEIKTLANDHDLACVLRKFSIMFQNPVGLANLWELLDVCRGKDDSLLSVDYRKRIIHYSHLTKLKKSEAYELELRKDSHRRLVKEQRLRQAAALYLKLGEMQRYCEILVTLGDWDRAIALSPSVSLEYWKSLVERRGRQLLDNGQENGVAYAIASGDAEKAVAFLHDKGDLNEATLLAQSLHESQRDHETPLGKNNSCRTHNSTHEIDFDDEHYSSGDLVNSNGLLPTLSRVTRRIALQMAEQSFQSGRAIVSACHHLSVDDFKGALSKVIRGYELDTAVTMATALGDDGLSDLKDIALFMLAMRILKKPNRELALELVQMTQRPQPELAWLCSHFQGSADELSLLYTKAGFAGPEECGNIAEDYLENDDIVNATMFFCLADQHSRAFEVGLERVKELMLMAESWNLNEIHRILRTLSFIRPSRLCRIENQNRVQLAILSAYIGALVAITRGFHSIVLPLFHQASELWSLGGDDITIPGFSKNLISQETAMWKNYLRRNDIVDDDPPLDAENATDAFEKLQAKLQGDKWPLDKGPFVMTGSNLPACSKSATCLLSGKRIQGEVHVLENSSAAISRNDAIMWCLVNLFSPLGTLQTANLF